VGDREAVADIAAGDPAGIAAAYDDYAASLYGYCVWMLRSPADAAEALKCVFVLTAATLGDLPEVTKLRSWLFALARTECRRRLLTSSRIEEIVASDQRTAATHEPVAAEPQPSHPASPSKDATLPFRAILQPIGAADLPGDATMLFRAFREPIGAADLPGDATMPFGSFRKPADAADLSDDATVILHAIRGPAVAESHPEETELPTQVRAIIAELKPRDREVIELSVRHGLDDSGLAIALGVPVSKAHALAVRVRGRLEEAIAPLLLARTGRNACPELGTLLTEWDGQLTEKTRYLLSKHIETCETCAARKAGVMRTAMVSELLPLVEPPVGLREQVLMTCFSATRDAVAYRRRAVRHAEALWSARFLPAIGLMWRKSGGEPRATAATMVLVAWVLSVWVVLVVLLIVTDPKLP
jgi:RNA polymerase sigma factor (sigma-70 family)